MFYENLDKICKARGLTVTGLAHEIGLASSSASGWKRGAIPRPKVIKAMADCLNVPISMLMDNSAEIRIDDLPRELKDTEAMDHDIENILEELRLRPDKRMLFQVLSGATPEDVTTTVAIIETLKRKRNG